MNSGMHAAQAAVARSLAVPGAMLGQPPRENATLASLWELRSAGVDIKPMLRRIVGEAE